MDYGHLVSSLLYEDGTSNLAIKYRRASIKACNIKLSIWFVRTCILEELTPRFCNFKLSKKLNDEEDWRIRKKFLKREIKIHYTQLRNTNLMLGNMVKHLNSLNNLERRQVIDETKCEVETLRIWKTDILKKKLEHLRTEKANKKNGRSVNEPDPPFNFHPNLINMSTVQFSEGEMKILNMGLKHSIPNHSKHQLDTLAVSVDAVLERSYLDADSKNEIRANCKSHFLNEKRRISKHNSRTKEMMKDINNIKKKIRENNLTVVKADKGACLVVLERSLYVSKVEEFLNDNGFTRLNNNPTSILINKVKNFKLSEEFENNYGKYRKLIHPNPKVPKLYGLPKLHKVNAPIRPVVSYVNTPVYKISQFLNEELKELTEFIPTYSIKNSIKLAESLKDLQIPEGAKLISLDAKNLFTSIPPVECVSLIEKELLKKNVNPELRKDILGLLKLSLEQNFCQFNNEIYKLEMGLPMGAPPSSLMAEIFMDNLEKVLFSLKTPIIKHIFKYYRYVDDILIIFTGSTDLAWVLLNLFNTLHENIHFTLEIGFNQINFLDLTLTLDHNRVSVDVHRKESQTVATINESSNHPACHKFAALNSYVHRMLHLPLSRDSFNRELQIIKYVAYKNGYTSDVVDRLMMRKFLKLHNESHRNDQSPDAKKQVIGRFSLPFYGNMCYPIKKIFEKHNIEIVFKANNCLHSHLLNCKDKTPILEKNGVYKLNCKTCDKFYIGKTFRALGTRISEHIRNYKDKSSFGRHLRINEHEFDESENVTLLHNLDKGNKLDLMEIYEIAKNLKTHQNKCLNTQTESHLSYHPIFESLI